MNLLRLHKKIIAIILKGLMFSQTFIYWSPAQAHNPSTPEMGPFTSVQLTEMVDKFTGDFNYNIPLFEIGNYPINLSYSSNVGLESKPSWVGLGWQLNPGNISRTVRGIPDEFQPGSDVIIQRDQLARNQKFSLGVSAQLLEITGKKKPKIGDLSGSLDVFYSNYNGLGFDFGLGLSMAPREGWAENIFPAAKVGLNFGSDAGISLSGELTMGSSFADKVGPINALVGLNSSVSGSYNSRSGLQALNYNLVSVNTSASKSLKVSDGTSRTIKASNVYGASMGGSFISQSQTYLPTTQAPVSTLSFRAAFSGGIEIFPVNPSLTITGSYMEQKLGGLSGKNPTMTRRFDPYGYIYYDEKNHYNETNSVYDFSRENDANISQLTPSYHLAFVNYDMFNVTAQGLSGAYRAKKSSPVTVVSDGTVDMNGPEGGKFEGANIGLEIGALKDLKGGLNGGVQLNEGYTGGWTEKDNASVRSKVYSRESGSNEVYKKYTFHQIGTMSPVNESRYKELLEDQAMTMPISESNNFFRRVSSDVKLNSLGGKVDLSNHFVGKYNQTSPLKSNYKNSTPIKEQQPLTAFTAFEMKQMEANRLGALRLYYKSGMEFSANDYSNFRLGGPKKGNHFSQLEVIKNDGTKYEFGLPVYSLKELDVSFNNSWNGQQFLPDQLFSKYDSNGGTPESKGVDKFRNEKEVSPHPINFLITDIKSSDYFDITGDGPSNDDLGNFVHFDYECWYDGDNPFKWKEPAAYLSALENQNGKHIYANINEGKDAFRDDNKYADDISSFTYGEKEVYYVKEMRSKEHVAVFHTSEIEGSIFSRSLSDIEGYYDDKKPLAKLDSVQVFTISEYALPEEFRVPEKTVHFVYDNSLAQLEGLDGNGKLTLRKVFFTYRNSQKSAISQYYFRYQNNPHYFGYNRNAWGGYQDFGGAPDFTETLPTRDPNAIENPFLSTISRQDADNNAGAWLLSEISLPTGGKITIDYEADDYAYVQDAAVGVSMKIAGFAKSISGVRNGDEFMNNTLYDDGWTKSRNYVFVDITDKFNEYGSNYGINPGGMETLQDYWDEAVRGMRHFPIRALVDIMGENKFEYVNLYASSGGGHGIMFDDATGRIYGYLKLKPLSYSKKHQNRTLQPIAKHALQMARSTFNDQVYGKSYSPTSDVKEVIKSFVGFARDFSNMIKGPIENLLRSNFGKTVILDKSTIVLKDPFKRKVAGTSRVKTVLIHDNWDKMTGNKRLPNISGWSYEYTRNSLESSGAQLISSGVAQWEPGTIEVENLNIEPLDYADNRPMAPDNSYYQLKPYGRSAFPSPSIGYSEVKVTPINSSGGTTGALGYSVYSFYTAKDYPLKAEHTNAQFLNTPGSLKPQFNFNGNKNVSVAAASQGFSIVLNDMHGKPKGERHFKQGQRGAYKTIDYFYKNVKLSDGNEDFESPYELDNHVNFIGERNVLYNSLAGIDYDVVIDGKQFFQSSKDIEVNFNLDFFMVGLGPFGFPVFIPSTIRPASYQVTMARSNTVTKVVNQYGILDRIETKENGAKTVSRNLVYDEISGTPILTQNNNEFNDPIYTLTYPAYWIYPNFKTLSERNGTILEGLTTNSQGRIVGGNSISGIGQNGLKPGDIIIDLKNPGRYQVTGIGNNLKLAGIDEFGPYGGLIQDVTLDSVKLVASGDRNMIIQSAGQITSKATPISNGRIDLNSPNFLNSVLAASAQTFNQFAYEPPNCICEGEENEYNKPEIRSSQELQELAKPLRWYPETTYSLLRDRNYTRNPERSFNGREDGTIKLFSPFWAFSSGRWRSAPGSGWTFTERNTKINDFGKPLESENLLEQNNAYGWTMRQTKMRYAATNAADGDVFHEDFEVYEGNLCNERDLAFPVELFTIDNPHTGSRSLQIEPGTRILINGVIE